MIQGPELLEALAGLERHRSVGGQFQQGLPAIGVDPLVTESPRRGHTIRAVGDRCTGEIQRPVVAVADDLDHVRVEEGDLVLQGEGEGGEYHTLFDTFDHYVRFHDPTFEYGVALTSVCGRLMLRLSEADVLPFEFTRAARTIGSYVDEVVKLANTMREKTEEWNRLVDEGHVARADDPTKKLSPAEKKKPVPNLNFAPLQNSSRRLKESAARCDAALAELAKEPDRLPIEHREQLEEILYRAEQALVHPDGLPRRPWFRHQVYAPGYYTGYGVKTLPGVREGIEERDWKETEEQIGRAAAALQRYAEEMERATELIERFGGED